MSEQKSSIMLVDDHPLLRKGLKQLLALEDELEVIAEASSGMDAIPLAVELDPDLIILDLNMQGMDGIATLKRLRDEGVTSRIVMLTVSDADEDVVNAISNGADGYLLKDSDPELLLELEGLANRGYTGGLLERRPAQDYQNYITGHSQFQRSQFVGEVQGIEGGWAEVIVKNRFDVGDTLEVIHPSGNVEMVLAEMRNLDGEPITAAPGSPLHVRVPLDERYRGALLARRLPQAA